jgi:hypothetical protein
MARKGRKPKDSRFLALQQFIDAREAFNGCAWPCRRIGGRKRYLERPLFLVVPAVIDAIDHAYLHAQAPVFAEKQYNDVCVAIPPVNEVPALIVS